MFGGVERTGHAFGRNTRLHQKFRGDRVHHRTGGEGLPRHVQFDRVENLARRQSSEVSDHLMGHLDLDERDLDVAELLLLENGGDRDLGGLAGRGRPVGGVLRVHQGESLVEIEFVDDVRLTLMDVDAPGCAVAGARPVSTVPSMRPDSDTTIATWVPIPPPRISTAP